MGNSLPQQHIDSLPAEHRADAYEKVLKVLFYRREGGHAEEEIAKWAGFPNVGVMHNRLEVWGCPGLLPQTAEKPKTRRKPPQAGGEREELPPRANAAAVFRDTIGTLQVFLEQVISLKETLQGRYFVSEGITDEPQVREVRGAQWHPHPHLVVLIVASILEHGGNWGHVERLLKLLHPRPGEANRSQLVRHIYGRAVDDDGRPKLDKSGRWKDEGDGLLYRTNQIAALIAGAPKVPTGPKPDPITSYDQYEAARIRLLMNQGLSPEQILRRYRAEDEQSKRIIRQNILEELETAKQELSEEDFARESRGAHAQLLLLEEPFDEDRFSQQCDIARGLE